MKRAAEGTLDWSGTQFPSQASAQDAEMSLAEYEDFVFSAGCSTGPTPSPPGRRSAKRQQRLVDFLNGKSDYHVKAANGTDVRMSVAGKRWINCDGHENFPDGEVFTGPVLDSVDGAINFSFPAVHHGREVQDVRLTFRDGKVVDASRHQGRGFPDLHARHGRRQPIPRRMRHRHQLPHPAVHAQHPLRRKDRRHRATSPSGRLSRNRQHQPIRPALGHGRRPPPPAVFNTRSNGHPHQRENGQGSRGKDFRVGDANPSIPHYARQPKPTCRQLIPFRSIITFTIPHLHPIRPKTETPMPRDWNGSRIMERSIRSQLLKMAGQVVGWASVSMFRPRRAYRPTVENAVYVPGHDLSGRKTSEKMLMIDLGIENARATSRGFIASWRVISAEQEASVRLHERAWF